MAILSAAMLAGVGGFTFFALWESLRPPARSVRAGGLRIELATTPDPVRVGDNQMELALRQDGQPVADARVELRWTLDPLAGRNPMALAEAEAVGDGRYRGVVAFRQPGPWQLTVLVKRPGRSDAQADYTFNLAADAGGATPAAIAGQVRVRPGLEARVPPGAALFVIARRGPGPPVAVKRFADPQLPLAFALTAADAMAGAPFEGQVEVVARLKMDGQAGPAVAGDLEGRAPAPVQVGTRDLVIEVDRAR